MADDLLAQFLVICDFHVSFIPLLFFLPSRDRETVSKCGIQCSVGAATDSFTQNANIMQIA